MSKTEEISLSTMQRDTEAHRKNSEITPKTLGHRMVSWSYPGHRGFNPLRFGHMRPEVGGVGPKQGA